MKKTVVLLVFFMCIAFVDFGFCEDIEGRWAVGLGGSYVQPEDAEYEDEPTYLGKATLGYGVGDNLAVELEFDTFRLKSTYDSKVRVSTALINLELRTKFWKVYPYAIGGIGWSFFSFDDITSDETKGESSGYAHKAGVGIEYFLNKDWAINYELVHFYADTGKTNLEVYNWQHSIGVKYYF